MFHGAREQGEGWVWKSDPYAGQGFGPFRSEWIGAFWRGLRARMLAVTGTEAAIWGPLPDAVIDERLSQVPAEVSRARVAGAGHFVHMEKPAETASLVRDYLEAA